MEKLVAILSEFSFLTVVLRIILAAVMGGLIGSERGRHGRAAGLRTHILVCIGSAMTSLTGIYVSDVLGYGGDVLRVAAQVVSGIGFLGAGMILVRNKTVVTGLTTAAGMWATAAIGIAVGFGFYSAAIAATIIAIFAVTVLSRLERKNKDVVYIYAEITDISATSQVIKQIRELSTVPVSIEVRASRSAIAGTLGLMVCGSSAGVPENFSEKIENIDYVAFAIEEDGL